MTTPQVSPGTQPPCQQGDCCSDSSDRTKELHKPECTLSAAGAERQIARIDALTAKEMRDAVIFLSGWTPAGVDHALDHVDQWRQAATLVPADMPEGAL